MIMKYIGTRFEDFDLKVQNILNKNKQYKEATKELKNKLDNLDRKVLLELDPYIIRVETLTKDLSFDAGFSEGIRFIMGCMNVEGEAK